MNPSAAVVIIKFDGLTLRTIEDGLLHRIRQIPKGGVHRETIVFFQGFQHLLVAQGMALGPGTHRSFPEGQLRVGHH